MIYFAYTEHQDLYNHLIHYFLKVTAFKNSKSLDKVIRNSIDKRLWREQYYKCKTAYLHLYSWSDDSLSHELSIFEESILYQFLQYIAQFQNLSTFKQNFFDEKGRELIKEAAKKDKENMEEEFDDWDTYDFEESYYHLINYEDALFRDCDFTTLDYLFSLHDLGNEKLEKHLGIYLDDFFELLPLDIQKKYVTGKITLYGNVFQFLKFFKEQITYHNLWKLFWNKNQMVSLQKIWSIVDNLLTAYFYNKNLQYLWNSSIDDEITFEIFQRFREEKKMILHFVTLDKYIYEDDIIHFDDESNQKKRIFYIFLCFNEREIQFLYNKERELDGICYDIFDLRVKKTASQK